MELAFSKYQGAGNDFVFFDDRSLTFPLQSDLIAACCHRQFGVGADGLVLVQPSTKADFKMRIFNADGTEASMCGNALRCFIDYLNSCGGSQKDYRIETLRHIHDCSKEGALIYAFLGAPEMHGFNLPLEIEGKQFILSHLNTGVPHVVVLCNSLEESGLMEIARKIRMHPLFSPGGVNVNFAKMIDQHTFAVRTYERGVERETLSCGTGGAAVSCVAWKMYGSKGPIRIQFGLEQFLLFELIEKEGMLSDISMTGPVKNVFKGTINLKELMNNM